MKNYILLLVAVFIMTLDSFAIEVSSDIGTEYQTRTLNRDSFLNPDNALDENSFAHTIRGSVAVKNEFNESSNGMLNLEGFSSPARYRNDDPENDVYIKEAYIDINQDLFSIRVGKQFLKWGEGVFFNPADVVNISRDPLRPVSEAEGTAFAQASVPLNSSVAVDVLAIVKENETEKLYRVPVCVRLSASSSELSGFIFAMRNDDARPILGASTSYVITPSDITTFTLYSEGHYRISSERNIAVETAEGFETEKRDDGNYTGIMTGQRTTLNMPALKRFDSYSLITEYYYDNENLDKDEFRNLRNAVQNDLNYASLYVPFKSSQHYIYSAVSVNNFFIDQATFSFGGVVNLADASTILIPSLSYLYDDYVSFTMKSENYLGNGSSEFGNAPAFNNTSMSITFSF